MSRDEPDPRLTIQNDRSVQMTYGSHLN